MQGFQNTDNFALFQAPNGMEDPHWQQILCAMYRSEPPEYMEFMFSTQGSFDNSNLKQILDLEEREINQAVDKLETWDLIEKGRYEYKGETRREYSLTKDGFEVAHDIELSRQDNRINYSLVVFTAFLVIVEGIAVVPLNDHGKSLLVVGLFMLLLLLVYRTDLLER